MIFMMWNYTLYVRASVCDCVFFKTISCYKLTATYQFYKAKVFEILFAVVKGCIVKIVSYI